MSELDNNNQVNKHLFTLKYLAVVVPILLLAGCGGGGSSSSSSTSTPSIGHFVDAATSGLQYSSTSYSGVTGTDGSFKYVPGETVTFSVGNVVLGSAKGGSVVTPMSLVSGSTPSTAQVQNIVRFLMMLDTDGNPSNGITINSAVRTAAKSWTLSVSDSSSTFTTDLNNIVSEVATADSRTVTVPTAADADTHLTSSYYCAYAGVSTGTFSGDDSGRWAYAVSPATGDIMGAAVDPQGFALGTGSLIAGASGETSLGITTTGFNFSGSVDEDGATNGSWSGYSMNGTYSGTAYDFGVTQPSGGELLSLFYSVPNAEVGFMRLAVDSSGNVTGKGFSGEAWITDPSAATYTVSGTLISGALNLTTSNGGTLSATVASDGSVSSSNWSGPYGNSTTVSGCRPEF